MGWCNGSEIAQDVWALVRGFIPTEVRAKIARKVIERFEDEDTDTMDEAVQLCKDAGRVHNEGTDEVVYVNWRKPQATPKSAAEIMQQAGVPNMLEGRRLNLRVERPAYVCACGKPYDPNHDIETRGNQVYSTRCGHSIGVKGNLGPSGPDPCRGCIPTGDDCDHCKSC